MPVLSDLSLASVTYNASAKTLTFAGVAFSENRYTGIIEISLNGGAYSTPAGTYTSWADGTVVYTLNAALASGTYAARLTNGDGQVSDPLAGAVVVAGAPPVISSLSPDSIPVTGGALEINGEFEDYANTTVTVDGVSVTPTSASATKITITAPAHSAGDVVVEVTDSYSQSDTEILTYAAVSTAAHFFFFQ